MSGLQLVRTLSIRHPDDEGATIVEVRELGDNDRLTPIMLQFLDGSGQITSTVALRWSEWEEVRDHVEYCGPIMKPEPIMPAEMGWVVCDVGPGLVPYEPLPCILERGHGSNPNGDIVAAGDPHHTDRRGRRW